MRLRMVSLGAILLFAIGCGQNEKIANLEKQNKELKAVAEKSHTTADYDFQAKCSKDARGWFKENWSPDKESKYLDFTNHYNKSLNRCFILVEHHYSVGENGSWMNDTTLWDVYENYKYGTFGENHMIFFKPKVETLDEVITCELSDKKCKTVGEFDNLVQPYMNN